MANRSVRKYNKNKSKKMSIRRRTSKSKSNSKNHTKLRSKNLKRSRRNSRKTRHRGGSFASCPPPTKRCEINYRGCSGCPYYRCLRSCL